jgi:hypothetical protein
MPDGPMPTSSGQYSAAKFERGQAGIELMRLRERGLCGDDSNDRLPIGRNCQENSEKGVVCRNGSCLKAMWADS